MSKILAKTIEKSPVVNQKRYERFIKISINLKILKFDSRVSSIRDFQNLNVNLYLYFRRSINTIFRTSLTLLSKEILIT